MAKQKWIVRAQESCSESSERIPPGFQAALTTLLDLIHRVHERIHFFLPSTTA